MTNNNRVIFLKGKKVNLRPYAKTDIPIMTRWVNDPDIMEFGFPPYPQTERQEEEWFNKVGSDDNKISLAIETKEGTLIGSISLGEIEWKRNRTAITGALIGEKEYRGKGYGTDAKMLLLDYAFNRLNLRKICSNVLASNKRSWRYNLRCGYKVEGIRKKQRFANGRYHDLIEFGIFKKDWLPIWKHYQKTGKVR